MGLTAPVDDRPVAAFVLDALPPGQVLEVGAGGGQLAATLRRAGRPVTAIDPRAVPGTRVQPATLERHAPQRRYSAVVAVRVLHHLSDLDQGLHRLAGLLLPRGRLIVSEFAPDRLDAGTAAWYLDRWGRAGRDSRGRAAPADVGTLIERWRDDLGDLHGVQRLLPALRRRFAECTFAWAPYLAGEYLDAAAAGTEVAAIRDGTIRATGYRFVGVPR